MLQIYFDTTATDIIQEISIDVGSRGEGQHSEYL